jgi:hypothetical protein
MKRAKSLPNTLVCGMPHRLAGRDEKVDHLNCTRRTGFVCAAENRLTGRALPLARLSLQQALNDGCGIYLPLLILLRRACLIFTSMEYNATESNITQREDSTIDGVECLGAYANMKISSQD